MTPETHSTVKRTFSVLLAICVAVGFSGALAGGALAATGEDVDGETIDLEDLDVESVDSVEALEADVDPGLVECIVEVVTNPYQHTCYVG